MTEKKYKWGHDVGYCSWSQSRTEIPDLSSTTRSHFPYLISWPLMNWREIIKVCGSNTASAASIPIHDAVIVY